MSGGWRHNARMKDAIFHNPRCSKSRQTLALLEARGAKVPVIEYLKTPPDARTLAEICKLLGIRPYDLVRRKEALFDEMKLSALRPEDDARWLQVLAEHPALLERPIVVRNGKAVVGRPPENVLRIL